MIDHFDKIEKNIFDFIFVKKQYVILKFFIGEHFNAIVKVNL